ncbi:MAG TPA: amidohydrolase family protein [Verrucomicrobiae bacterium]|jgi:imidazolonepropionase-like amidohydrolase|nr:amidohydrolase family protein [Verrucomicrobiae bacterium]
MGTFRFFLKLFILIAALASAVALSSAQSSPEFALRCDNMWDGRSSATQAATIIVVSGERIKSILPPDKAPAGSTPVNAHGTCMPGMIDVHTHVFLQQDAISPTYDDQLLKQSVAFRTIRAVRSASLALEHGFTTIRDLETEGAGYADVDLRDAIADGIVPGPTMQVAGRALDVTGAYPLEGYAPEIQPLLPHGVEVVDGVEAARKAVREQISYGIDWIKMYADRGARLDGDTVHGIPTFTVEEAKAIVDEAHRERHRVACHARSTEGVELALLAGVDTIEHGEYITDQQLSEMKQRGIYYVPTLWDLKYTAGRRHNPQIEREFQIAQQTLVRAMNSGVKIAFGTDIGGFDWKITPAKQMEVFVAAGMTPEQALLTSIQTGAELMGISGDAGSLTSGQFADIIVVSGDPLKNVISVEQVEMTIKHGRIYQQNRN